MKHLFLLTALISASVVSAACSPTASQGPKEKHHVRFTYTNGVEKCFTKKTREKAERVAEILRKVNSVRDVHVEPGPCKKD